MRLFLENKVQVIIFDNGAGVSTVTPAPQRMVELQETMTELEALTEIATQAVPQGQAWEIVDSATLDTTAPDELREWI